MKGSILCAVSDVIALKTPSSFFSFFISSVLSVRASPRPDIGDSLVSSSMAEPGTSFAPDTSRDEHNSSSGNRPRVGGANKGPVPKWFKGTGKGVLLWSFF